MQDMLQRVNTTHILNIANVSLKNFLITLVHDFFEISRIKLFMFTINPTNFHLSLPKIQSNIDISNDIEFLGTPCIELEMFMKTSNSICKWFNTRLDQNPAKIA